MEDSAFSPSFGNRPRQLVGRDEVLGRIVEGLRTEVGNRERATIVLGQRGSGKTVLLWEIADQARRQGFVVANPTTATEGMLDRIIEKIQVDGERHMTRGTASITNASFGALGFSVGLQFSRDTLETKSFHFKLRSLCKTLERLDRGVLILVDELQANTPDMRQLVGAYQELVGERLNVALILAGLPGAVSGTLNDRVLTFLNRATRISLEPLPIGEVDAYFASSFRTLGIDIPTDIRRSAAEATEGSPYMMQLVGHYLTRFAADGRVDERGFADALHAAVRDFEQNVCQTTIAARSSQDIAFLQELAECEGPGRTSDIAARLGVTTDYAQKYRKRLIDAGIVAPVARGYVDFAVPYLRDWLRSERL